MAIFSVSVTQNTTPAISVTMSGNTTYQQFKNSLGNFVYNIEQAYVYSENLEQIQGAFLFSKYDSSGVQKFETVPSTIDPYQSQNALYIDTKSKNIIFDGRDYVRFRLLPNTSLSIKLFSTRISNQDKMSGVNNFQQLEESTSNANFFEDYNDFI